MEFLYFGFPPSLKFLLQSAAVLSPQRHAGQFPLLIGLHMQCLNK